MQPSLTALKWCLLIQFVINIVFSQHISDCLVEQTSLQNEEEIQCADLKSFITKHNKLKVVVDYTKVGCEADAVNGKTNIKKINDNKLVDFTHFCRSLQPDNDEPEENEPNVCIVKIPNSQASLCRWSGVKQPYNRWMEFYKTGWQAVDKQYKDVGREAEQLLFMSIRGFDIDPNNLQLSWEKINAKDMYDKSNKYPWARTKSTLSLGRQLSKDDKLTGVEIMAGHGKFKEYEVRQQVDPDNFAQITDQNHKGFDLVGALFQGAMQIPLCSAVVIAKNWLLTCAHCVVNKYKTGKVFKYKPMRFAAGYNGEKLPVIPGKDIIEIVVPLGYMAGGEEYDFALLKVYGRGFDRYFSIAYDNNNENWEGTFHTSGYPSDKIEKSTHTIKQWYQPLQFTMQNIPTLQGDVKVAPLPTLIGENVVIDPARKGWPGQSGSGVWKYDNRGSGTNDIMGVYFSGCFPRDHKKRIDVELEKVRLDAKKQKNTVDDKYFPESGSAEQLIERMKGKMQENEDKFFARLDFNMKVLKRRKKRMIKQWKALQKNGFGGRAVRITGPKFWRILKIIGFSDADIAAKGLTPGFDLPKGPKKKLKKKKKDIHKAGLQYIDVSDYEKEDAPFPFVFREKEDSDRESMWYLFLYGCVVVFVVIGCIFAFIVGVIAGYFVHWLRETYSTPAKKDEDRSYYIN